MIISRKLFYINPGKLSGYKGNVIQFIRFGIAGIICALFELGTLLILVDLCSIHYLVSNIFAFTIANITNYLLSRLWVFGKGKYKLKAEIVGFFIVAGIGLALSQLVLFVAFEKFDIILIYSKLIAIVITVNWNFFAKKYIIFRK